VHVSDWVGPVTPKFAVAAIGRVTESMADTEVPPYVAVMVATMVPPTARVAIVNDAAVNPPATVTLAGTLTGSALDRDTTAPPDGAAAVSVTAPVTKSPPTTLGALKDNDASAAGALTVIVGDWRLLPPNDAVTIAVPGATGVRMNVPLAAPTGIVRVGGTVTTAELLLVSAIVASPAGAAPVKVTVPCRVVPIVIVEAVSATAERDVDAGAVGWVLLPPLH